MSDGLWRRTWAVMVKETIQMRRDRLTFAMMVGIPLMHHSSACDAVRCAACPRLLLMRDTE